MTEKYTCPICGYPELDEPAYDKLNCASFEICPCCGYQFGYSDAGFTHEQLSKEWIDRGCKWEGSGEIPPKWDSEKQLHEAGFDK